MLPETQAGRKIYLEMRDHRSRWREMHLRQCAGDLDAFKAHTLLNLAHDAEIPVLREIADFAESEGMLTPELKGALDTMVAWGEEIRRLIQAGGVA